MKKILFLLSLCFVPAFLMAQTVAFSDNFDSYTADKYICLQNTKWNTWENKPGTPQDAFISTEQSFSAPNALKISGESDIVYQFGNLTSGEYEISFNMYIPESSEMGYFNVIHYFSVSGSIWAFECYLYPENSSKNSYIYVNSQENYFDNPPANTWLPVLLHIDIDNDLTTLTINGKVALEWPFKQTQYSYMTSNVLSVLDFYANKSTFYIDDFNVKDYAENVNCPTPKTPVVSNVTGHTAEVTWEPNGDETSWELQSQTGKEDWKSVILKKPFYKFEDLPGKSTTSVRVRALCSETEMSKWTYTVFTTDITCPSPESVDAAKIYSTNAQLVWNPIGKETSWEFSIGESKEIMTATIVNDHPDYFVKDLTPNKTYYIAVRAICAVKDTSVKIFGYFTTPDSCLIPIDLTFSNVEKNSASASWKAGGQEKSWYVQYRKAGETDWPKEIFTPRASYKMTDLEAGTKYEFRVQANCNDVSVSDFLTGEFETKAPDPCTIPTNLTAGNVTTGMATLTWEQTAEDAKEWEVMYREEGLTDWEHNLTVTEKTTTIKDLKPATKYEAAVMAHCADMNSELSELVKFTTLEETCDAPTDLKVDNITHHSADLTWKHTDGTAKEWVVNYRVKDATEWTQKTVSALSATLEDLTELTSYEAMVVAHCTNGVISDNSDTIVFTTVKNAISDYDANISLYPNPTTGIITCNVNALDVERVEVYDIYGKLLQAFYTNESIIHIDASGFADGLYFVRICAAQGSAHKTFFKR